MNDNSFDESLSNNSKKITLTAEYPEGVIVNQFVVERKFLRGENYIRVFSDPLATIAEDKDFKYTDLRVFLKLLSYMGYENVIQISQAALGKDLDLAQSHVSKSLKKLIAKKYIELIGQVGKQNIYRLNPYFGFKSKARNLEELQKTFNPIEKSNLD